MDKGFYTTGELVTYFGVSPWQVRRVLDGMGSRVRRAGLYRLVPAELLPEVEAELRRRGYLKHALTEPAVA